MSRIHVGIVDYGVGNHTSVVNALKRIGFKCTINDNRRVLSKADVILLPGVGAFPPAKHELQKRGLVEYLQHEAKSNKPILGICLGMQLLAEVSYEFEKTSGIALMPGEIVPLATPQWHIGWNTVELVQNDKLFEDSDGNAFYFNHSFVYKGPAEYQVGVVNTGQVFPAIVRRGRTVGIQFHPEKSQDAGSRLLKKLIVGLLDA